MNYLEPWKHTPFEYRYKTGKEDTWEYGGLEDALSEPDLVSIQSRDCYKQVEEEIAKEKAHYKELSKFEKISRSTTY